MSVRERLVRSITHIAQSALAVVVTFCWMEAARSQDVAVYQSSIEKLAHASKPFSDPRFLAGIGQIYCQMKAVVGDQEPLRPETVLAVLHQKHPDTQPKSNAARDAQRKAMLLAAELLCPDTGPPATP